MKSGEEGSFRWARSVGFDLPGGQEGGQEDGSVEAHDGPQGMYGCAAEYDLSSFKFNTINLEFARRPDLTSLSLSCLYLIVVRAAFISSR